MSQPTPIDITNIPDLVRIAEEVKATKKPRELGRDNQYSRSNLKSIYQYDTEGSVFIC